MELYTNQTNNALKKLFLLFFALLFLQSFVIAASVGSQEVPLNVTVGEEYVFNIEITNTATYKLYDVQFKSANSVMSPVDIEPNSTTIATISYTSVAPGTYSEVLEMVGYNKISCVDAPSDVPTEITINSSGAFPSDVTVCTNTEVVFINEYSDWVQLRVYPENSFGNQIPSGDSDNRVFSNVGNYNFEILPILINGVVHVSVDDVLVHSSAEDVSLQLNVFSSYRDTVIDVGDVGLRDFVVPHNGIGESFLVVNNLGSERVMGVSFVGDSLGWFSFDSSGFDLEVGSNRAVNFVVSPVLSNTSDTNKSYDFSIGVESLNAGTVFVNFSVFVPFVEVLNQGNISSSSYWYNYWMDESKFCVDNPTAPSCYSDVLVVGGSGGVGGVGCPDILLNLSSEKLYFYLIESLKGQSTSEKAFNMIKADLDERKVFRSGMVNLTNVTNLELAEFGDRVDDLEGSFLVVIVLGLLVLIVGFIGFIGWQFYSRSVREGGKL